MTTRIGLPSFFGAWIAALTATGSIRGMERPGADRVG